MRNGDRADVEQAQRYDATGVPFFVVDHRYGVSGAQPSEVLRQVLDRAWADTHPTLQMVGTAGEDACEDTSRRSKKIRALHAPHEPERLRRCETMTTETAS